MTTTPLPPRLSSVTTLVFDVMGTVVDIDTSLAVDLRTVLRRRAPEALAQAEPVLKSSESELNRLMDEVRSGTAEWQSHRHLRRLALRTAFASVGIADPAPEMMVELAGGVSRLEPWPDSPAALTALRDSFTVVALSNADLAELAALSRLGGLAWHAVLSGELVRSFKPDPAVYRTVTDRLGLEPAEILMVAAHPWDLRAAAEQGFATAYVARPGAERPGALDGFDVQVDDLGELAELLS